MHVTDIKLPNKNFFTNNFIIDIFLFVAAITSLLATTLAIYLLYKHRKLRMSITSLALQQIREVGGVTRQEDITTTCDCTIQFYIILALSISILGIVIFAVLHSRKLKLCRECLFSNVVKIMLFISDVQYYVPIKSCKTAGSIHVFKITGMLKLGNIKLKWYYIWDIIEIDWKEVNVTFNGNKINLPKSVMIKFSDKFKIRQMMMKDPLLFHIMLKQGFTWFTLASGNPPIETVYINIDTFPEWISTLGQRVTFSFTMSVLPSWKIQ